MKTFRLFSLFMLRGAVLAQAPNAHADHLPAPAAQPEQHVHDAATPVQPAPMAATAQRADDSAAMQEARHMSMMMHGDSLNYLLLGERFEYNDNDGFTQRLLLQPRVELNYSLPTIPP